MKPRNIHSRQVNLITALRILLLMQCTFSSFTATSDDSQITFQTTSDAGARTLWRMQGMPAAVPENLSAKLDAIAKFPGEHAGPISVSPDGLWYVFQSSRFAEDASGSLVLTIAPADFSTAETIHTSQGVIYNEGMAQATARGDAIIYSDSGATHTRDLYIIRRNASGWSDPVCLTQSSPFAFHSWPRLSADGAKVVFNASDQDQYGSAGTRIAEVRLDGSGFRVLAAPADGPAGTTSDYCSFPAYSADGQSVFFEALWGGSEQIWNRSLAGGAATIVNGQFTDDNSPAVLPDGRVVSLWLGSAAGNGLHEIKVMNANGADYSMLTAPSALFSEIDDIGLGAGPMWGPKLAIEQSGANAKISWPTAFADFTLESTRDFSSQNWTTVVTTTNSASVTIQGAQFFRLRK
jgi:Tol biopolymer transport system component